jgi:hypothetical protein
MTPTGTMAKPFGGGAATAISSAAAGAISPLVPSVFAQSLNKQRQQGVREHLEQGNMNYVLTVILNCPPST